MLLHDTIILDAIQILSESKSKGTMKIRGVFQRADEANKNKRRYTQGLLENQIEKLRPMFEGRQLLGEMDHPSYENVKLQNASHLITDLKMQGGIMMGEAEILNTPSGKVIQSLIRDGVQVGISSRGVGSLGPVDESGIQEVNDDYQMITFDMVADPSTHGAYPGMVSESTQINSEKIEKAYKNAFGEKVFLTLLKNKLEEGQKFGIAGMKIGSRGTMPEPKPTFGRVKTPEMTPEGEKFWAKADKDSKKSKVNSKSSKKASVMSRLKRKVKDTVSPPRGFAGSHEPDKKVSEGSAGLKKLLRRSKKVNKQVDKDVEAGKFSNSKTSNEYEGVHAKLASKKKGRDVRRDKNAAMEEGSLSAKKSSRKLRALQKGLKSPEGNKKMSKHVAKRSAIDKSITPEKKARAYDHEQANEGIKQRSRKLKRSAKDMWAGNKSSEDLTKDVAVFKAKEGVRSKRAKKNILKTSLKSKKDTGKIGSGSEDHPSFPKD